MSAKKMNRLPLVAAFANQVNFHAQVARGDQLTIQMIFEASFLEDGADFVIVETCSVFGDEVHDVVYKELGGEIAALLRFLLESPEDVDEIALHGPEGTVDGSG